MPRRKQAPSLAEIELPKGKKAIVISNTKPGYPEVGTVLVVSEERAYRWVDELKIASWPDGSAEAEAAAKEPEEKTEEPEKKAEPAVLSSKNVVEDDKEPED